MYDYRCRFAGPEERDSVIRSCIGCFVIRTIDTSLAGNMRVTTTYCKCRYVVNVKNIVPSWTSHAKNWPLAYQKICFTVSRFNVNVDVARDEKDWGGWVGGGRESCGGRNA